MAGFKLTWRGAEVEAAFRRGASRGLAMAGEHLVGQARREVPLREGTLSRSIRATVDDAASTLAVSADTPYARRQHEDETLDHPGGRKAKYIEDPMTRERDVMLGLVAAAIRREYRA